MPQPNDDTYDLVIIGSGFGGSLLAMVARQIGLSVLLLEKGRHPRFAIGESTSPLANLLIEELAHRYHLPRLLPLATYGAWQNAYPHLGCGLKRGFSYYKHEVNQARQPDPNRNDQLLVAASPGDSVADTHWLRADVDAFLLYEALALGTYYHDQVCLHTPYSDTSGIAYLTGLIGPEKRSLHIRARFVVDATGPNGYLSRALRIPVEPFPGYPPTQALFNHFTGVARVGTDPAFTPPSETPPYPPDDAALHHIFDGGWMWVLRFGNGITSAGVALTDAAAQKFNLSEGAPAWNRLLKAYPSVRAQFADATPTRDWTYSPRLASRATQITGPGWCLLPSAAAFVDPLFSTGIPLTLLGIERLGKLLENFHDTEALGAGLADYQTATLSEADATADFIGACYAAMPRFPLFTALAQFYFAAASYSEMTRRLEKRHLVRRFLASDHATFAPQMRACTAWVRQNAATATPDDCRHFTQHVHDAIACLNIAGLSDPAKHNWYDVDLQDLVRNAPRLELTPTAMQTILKTAPWAQIA